MPNANESALTVTPIRSSTLRGSVRTIPARARAYRSAEPSELDDFTAAALASEQPRGPRSSAP
eukprot:10805209-Heterocapsa_arctica.AAC.1